MSIRRISHNPSMLVRGGLCRSDEDGDKELSKIKVPEDIGSELHVVIVRRDEINGGQHDTGGIEQNVESSLSSDHHQDKLRGRNQGFS